MLLVRSSNLSKLRFLDTLLMLMTTRSITDNVSNTSFSRQYISNVGNNFNSMESDGKIFWFEESSTMETAKELANNDMRDSTIFGVGTKILLNGRGTHGRNWQQTDGDVTMTFVLNMDLIKIPLTLCPLRMATLILPSIQSRSNSRVYLKWPNDILIEEKKISGILIQIIDRRMYVGFGINVPKAPIIPPSGINGGRPATCLADHMPPMDPDLLLNLRKSIAEEIMTRCHRWLTSSQIDTVDNVLDDFQRDMSMSARRLRSETLTFEESDEILPLRLNRDGTLQVRFTANNTETTLIADYTW